MRVCVVSAGSRMHVCVLNTGSGVRVCVGGVGSAIQGAWVVGGGCCLRVRPGPCVDGACPRAGFLLVVRVCARARILVTYICSLFQLIIHPPQVTDTKPQMCTRDSKILT